MILNNYFLFCLLQNQIMLSNMKKQKSLLKFIIKKIVNNCKSLICS
ncbi:hypothetical protein ykris0001_41110 [Yersinia kristensenii ATCC 33638]|nr:hypothetical protein ykris0001_41110 [Yersinia kristensenii ATCC 33638]